MLVSGGSVNNSSTAPEWPAAEEIYDPKTERWQKAAKLATPRAYHSATSLPDGSVLIVGGWDLQNTLMSCVEGYAGGGAPAKMCRLSITGEKLVWFTNTASIAFEVSRLEVPGTWKRIGYATEAWTGEYEFQTKATSQSEMYRIE